MVIVRRSPSTRTGCKRRRTIGLGQDRHPPGELRSCRRRQIFHEASCLARDDGLDRRPPLLHIDVQLGRQSALQADGDHVAVGQDSRRGGPVACCAAVRGPHRALVQTQPLFELLRRIEQTGLGAEPHAAGRVLVPDVVRVVQLQIQPVGVPHHAAQPPVAHGHRLVLVDRRAEVDHVVAGQQPRLVHLQSVAVAQRCVLLLDDRALRLLAGESGCSGLVEQREVIQSHLVDPPREPVASRRVGSDVHRVGTAQFHHRTGGLSGGQLAIEIHRQFAAFGVVHGQHVGPAGRVRAPSARGSSRRA